MRTDRRVKRNIERAIAGRTFNEKRMKQQVFYQGIKFGVQMERSRLLSSTAQLTYEEVPTNEAISNNTPISNNIPVDVASDGPVNGVLLAEGSPDLIPPPSVPA